MLDHKQLIINAYIENPPLEKDIHVVEDWLKELVESINMKIVDGPFVRYVSAEGNEGITAAVLIETSHIACHVWEKASPPYIRLDVYSCACFENSIIINSLKRFGLKKYDYMFLDRNNEIKILEFQENAEV